MSYFEKAKSVIKNEGFATFFRKVNNRLITPIRLKVDIFFAKFFSRAYIKGFHKFFYYRFFSKSPYEKKIFWLGKEISKLPLDSWIYQEILWELKPDVLVECGTDKGGSAFFFASIFDLLGKGEVITIDINDTEVPHPRVTKIKGSSVSEETYAKVKKMAEGKKVMVVLDSDHTRDHVIREMKLYGELVTPGFYMVVEDSNINGHPVLPGWGAGPMEAIKKFLKQRNDFVIDISREKFGVTFYPRGFLKKVVTSKK